MPDSTKNISKPAVCICIDRNLMWNISHVYFSIKEFCADFDFYILCDKDVVKYKMEKWEECATVIYDVDIPQIDISRLKGGCRIRNKAMYYRFIAPYLIKTDRLIYTDNDVIFNSDIRELWKKNLNGKLAAAVEDPLRLKVSRHFDLQSNMEYLKDATCRTVKKFYASGLLVIDSAKWRKNDMRNEILKLYHDHPMLDMLLFNIACAGKIKRLADSWCVPANYMKDGMCINTGRIYKTIKCWHWHGRKPWGRRGRSGFGKEIYQKYARQI